MNTHNLIEKLKHAIENHNVNDAVHYDTQLHALKTNTINNIQTQSKLHSHQMEYIKNFKMMYYASQSIKLLLSVVALSLFFNTEGLVQFGFIGISVIGAFLMFAEYRINYQTLKTLSYMLERMNIEKTMHVLALQEVDVISEFQKKIENRIGPLYERYANDNPSTLENLFANLQNIKEDQEDTDIDNSSDV